MATIKLKEIEEQAAKLSLQDHIKLMETLARQLREKSESSRPGLDWTASMASASVGAGRW
jgi:hypothetical protein